MTSEQFINAERNAKWAKVYKKKSKDLTEYIKRLEKELEDWRDSQRRIMSEVCPGDERHCTCVPPLRREVKALEKQNKELEEGIANFVTKYRQYNTMYIGNSIEVSIGQFLSLYKYDVEKLYNLLNPKK